MRTPFRDAFDGHLGQIATRDGPALRTALIDPGTDDNDTLSAGPGFDLLLGFGGEDRLVAGQNLDILIGGADADSYVFAPSSTGFKIVLGFEEGVDTLDLSAFTDIHDLRQIDVIKTRGAR